MKNWYEIIVRIRDNILYARSKAEDVEDCNRMLHVMDKMPHVFYVTDDDLKALQDYFYKRAGYISPEFDGKVLEFASKIDAYLKVQ